MMVASTIAAVAEALLFAERGGADPAKVREALLGGFADSTVLRQHGQRMIASNFVPGGPAKYQVKDTSTALALSRSLGLELPLLGLVDRLFGDMVSHGDGDRITAPSSASSDAGNHRYLWRDAGRRR